jgi:hypothetical protein
MGWFKKNVEPTLDEIHEAAERLAEDALGFFHTAVYTLQDAAGQHNEVAAKAQTQADELAAKAEALTTLSISAKDAAAAKLRQADAIANLVS